MDLFQKSRNRGIRMGRLDVDHDVDRRGGSWNMVGPTDAPLRVRKRMMPLAPCDRSRRNIDACVRPRVAVAQKESTAPATTATYFKQILRREIQPLYRPPVQLDSVSEGLIARIERDSPLDVIVANVHEKKVAGQIPMRQNVVPRAPENRSPTWEPIGQGQEVSRGKAWTQRTLRNGIGPVSAPPSQVEAEQYVEAERYIVSHKRHRDAARWAVCRVDPFSVRTQRNSTLRHAEVAMSARLARRTIAAAVRAAQSAAAPHPE